MRAQRSARRFHPSLANYPLHAALWSAACVSDLARTGRDAFLIVFFCHQASLFFLAPLEYPLFCPV
jgi:hypothetical protein